MGLGFRHIGTKRLTWRLLVGLVKHSPPDSALMRVTHGEQVAWSAGEYLLAIVVDLLQYLVWFQTKDGHEGRNRPKPVTRPGTRPVDGTSLGGRGIASDLVDFNAKFAVMAAKQAAEKAALEAGTE
jgi:hypothetical protein